MRSLKNVVRAVAVLMLLAPAVAFAQADKASMPRIHSQGFSLPGNEFGADCAFDFIDWNFDGKLDLHFPSTSMNTGIVYLNEGTRTEPRFGNLVWHATNLTETSPYGMFFVQNQTLCDLNHDGLVDLLVFDGQLRFVHNTGTKAGPNHWKLFRPAPYFPGSPKMIKDNARRTNTPQSMYWNQDVFPRQVLTMAVADWDGDGLEDLIVCRFKDEAPGLKTKLPETPARELWFYKNVGDLAKPFFDKGVEITTPDGKPIAAPNPIVVDVDGDGILDVVCGETPYLCNSFRVDWPTNPSTLWFRRPNKGDVSKLEPGVALTDSSGKPIPSGTQVRAADFRNVGVKDLFVLDPQKGIRWYHNTAKSTNEKMTLAGPKRLTAQGFARFGCQLQIQPINWYGPNSRDLLMHGGLDPHCQYALRRTALYKNVATRPGELKYEYVGFFKFQDDLAMIPQKRPYEDHPFAVYGGFVEVMPDDAHGKRFLMSVNGKLYVFSKLAADGLTFQERTPLELPADPERKLWRSCPKLVDWNGDGKLDLVLGILWAKNAQPHEKEYRVYLNKGTNEQPKFDQHVAIQDETGKPLVMPAQAANVMAPQCGIALHDRDGTGKMFDLITEEPLNGSALRFYRNVSTDPAGAPRFQFVKKIGDPLPVDANFGNNRGYTLADFDGDGVSDLLTSHDGIFYKGIAPDAPPEVGDLAVASSGKAGIEVRWKRPKGAATFDLRVGPTRYINDSAWTALPATTGKYTIAEGETQSATVPAPAGVQECFVAVKSANGKNQPSGMSNVVRSAALPWKEIVLRNGPQGNASTPEYQGTEACNLEGSRPNQSGGKPPALLEVKTSTSERLYKEKLILLRFKDLSKHAGFRRATLELTTDPALLPRPHLLFMAPVDVTCSSIRDDWDPFVTSFTHLAPNKPWPKGELEKGGVYQSLAMRPCMAKERHVVEWDVTPAVREAQGKGRDSINLLIRAEYTGPYSLDLGYAFCGPAWVRIEHRPRLVLIGKE